MDHTCRRVSPHVFQDRDRLAHRFKPVDIKSHGKQRPSLAVDEISTRQKPRLVCSRQDPLSNPCTEINGIDICIVIVVRIIDLTYREEDCLAIPDKTGPPVRPLVTARVRRCQHPDRTSRG